MTFFASFALTPGPATAGSTDVPSSEKALLAAMNQVRAQHGAAPLRFDFTLRRAARSHSLDMLRRGYFAHGPVGRRLQRFGVRGPAVGENLAWGGGGTLGAQAIVRMWLASPPHRANLLRPGFRRVGVGLVTGSFQGYAGATVVTADFAGR